MGGNGSVTIANERAYPQCNGNNGAANERKRVGINATRGAAKGTVRTTAVVAGTNAKARNGSERKRGV